MGELNRLELLSGWQENNIACDNGSRRSETMTMDLTTKQQLGWRKHVSGGTGVQS